MSSLLHAEILEQPGAVRRLLDAQAEHVAEIARRIAAKDVRFVVIAGRGTSDNAARYGQYLFGARNGWTVALATPSLFTLYRRPPRMPGALVIGISQSGQSPDVASVVAEARAQGSPTVAITNDARSPLANAAEYVVDLNAGDERSVAATKTYTAELTALAMLSLALSGDAQRTGDLETIPELLRTALGSEPAARAAAEKMKAHDRCVVLGRGFEYATAFEIALKIQELSYVQAEPYSSADFRHGPIAMIAPGFPIVLVAVGRAVRDEIAELRATLRERSASLVVLGDDEAMRDPSDSWIPVPAGAPDWLTPLVSVVPGQLLAYHLAIARGTDPDQPRSLRKVTRTR
ncbi:MAG: SIS domain-containing protein [Planctomycetes bacterium]|nr:SIS domain-containing protein [Planctomycetota bacterium]MBI3845688.1 SIS domain-containing protein [Planctomycetota bacterium]